MFVRLSKEHHRKLAKIRQAESLPSAEAALVHSINVAAVLADDSPPPSEEDGDEGEGGDEGEDCGDPEPAEA